MFKWLRFKRFMKRKKSFDANVQGFLLTKSSRICSRIETLTASYLKKKTITKKDVRRLTKSIQIMIGQELTYKGIEEEKKGGKQMYIFSGKAKDWSPEKWQKIEPISEPPRQEIDS